MDDQNVRNKMQMIVDEAFPQGAIDLWPKLKTRLPAKPGEHQRRVGSFGETRTSRRRHLGWAALGMSLMALAVMAFFTPQGKALAQEVLSFFLRQTGNTREVPAAQASLIAPPQSTDAVTETQTPPVADEGCGSLLAPRCSLEEVAAQAQIPLLMPAELPDGMTFSGAALLPGGVVMKYEGELGTLLLAQSAADAQDLTTWTIAQDTVLEHVMVDQQPGEYVLGWWGGFDPSLEGMPWDPDLPTRTLRWSVSGVQFTVINFPAQSPEGPLGLDKAQMIALAESIDTGISPSGDLEGLQRTLEEVAEQAGFAFIETAWLPDGVAAYGARYDSQHNAICQYYRTSADDVTTTLVIAQTRWALPAPEDLLRSFTYGDQVIEMPVQQAWVPVEGSGGESAMFIESGLAVEAFCGGEQTNAHRALMWTVQDRSYIIFAQLDANDGRSFVTVKEMQHLAGVLNGSGDLNIDDTTPDPERLRSLAEAEEIAGTQVRFPGVMLASVRFDHIAIRALGSDEEIFVTAFVGQPVGDGRRYGVTIFQAPNSVQTVENLELAGGYRRVTVKSNPAIYQESCWDSTALASGTECRQLLTWFEDGAQFDLETYFPALVPEDVVLAIAESIE